MVAMTGSGRAQAVPVRDQVPTGNAASVNGVVRVRVVDASSRQPLHNAEVRLSGPKPREPRFGVTDIEGAFSFAALPPGSYTVTAVKAGYATLSYGQRQGWETPAQVEVTSASTVAVDLPLPRSGVIVVRALNSSGEPFAGLEATALSRRFDNGRAVWTRAGAALNAYTDDRGEARLFGLAPGDYYVSARSGLSSLLGRSRLVGETFYPGTPSLARAERIPVTPGSETTVTFVVEPASLARISGTIFDASGAPLTDGTVTLTQYQTSRQGSQRIDRRPDGSFASSALEPGDYVLRVVSGPRPGGVEYASEPLLLNGVDINTLTLRTRPGAVIRGSIVFDEPAGHAEAESLLIRLVPSGDRERPQSLGLAQIQSDLSFEIKDVMAEGVIRVDSGGEWRLKSVILDGRDIADLPMDFGARVVVNDLRVLLTRRSAQIVGAVDGFAPGETPHFVVVLFPADHNLWTSVSRRIAVGRLDQNGRFAIAGLPAGDYQVVAAEGLQPGAERHIETLRALSSGAVAVQLREGEVTSLTIAREK